MRIDCKKLATRLQEQMKAQKLSQADLSRKSGESPMQVSRVCTGVQMPSAISLHKMTEAVGCEVSDLLG